MDIAEAYNEWSDQYDSNHNRTRDLEATVLRRELEGLSFTSVLEIGCGTGKNTEWLLEKAKNIIAVDFSEKMLEKARQKINSGKVSFVFADINHDWKFTTEKFDLVTCSLVLEHIEDLQKLFMKVASVLDPGGFCYIGELHPFRQYKGSKARFESKDGMNILDCYTHHVSDFTLAAGKSGLRLKQLHEYFDDDDRSEPPRILSIIFEKI